MAKDIDWKSERRIFAIKLRIPQDMIYRLIKIAEESDSSVESVITEYITECLPDKENI